MTTLPLPAQDGNPTKICSKCKRDLPATPEFFHHKKAAKDGLYAQCKTCTKQKNAQSYAKHSEDRRQYAAQYRAEHPEQVRMYRETHREQHKGYDYKRYWENKEQELLRSTKYHQEHADELRAKRRQYYQTPRGIIAKRAAAHNRRALKRHAEGTHTTKELYQQLQRQKGKCYWCHVKLDQGRDGWHGDHIIPLSKGGRNSIDNIVIACPTCNMRKHGRLPHEWPEGGRLL